MSVNAAPSALASALCPEELTFLQQRPTKMSLLHRSVSLSTDTDQMIPIRRSRIYVLVTFFKGRRMMKGSLRKAERASVVGWRQQTNPANITRGHKIWCTHKISTTKEGDGNAQTTETSTAPNCRSTIQQQAQPLAAGLAEDGRDGGACLRIIGRTTGRNHASRNA